MKNSVNLIGNLGTDPEIKTLESGAKLARFPLATSETYKTKDGEKKTETQWHNITIWGKLADIVESYVKKGDRLDLEGSIKYRKYEDKEGVERYATEIVCNQMIMLGGNSNGQSQPADIADDNETDDLPF